MAIIATLAMATWTAVGIGAPQATRTVKFPAPANRQKVERSRDPVCGLMVERNSTLSVRYKSETYYFCSKADMDQFRRTPERYVKK
jgi:YHS domain-containing protein